MLGEERLGRPLDEAIDAMCERIGSPDLEYVATAINVQAQTGGSLAGLFDTLSETVRERQRHARKVHALTVARPDVGDRPRAAADRPRSADDADQPHAT